MRYGGKLLRFVGVEVTGALVELEELIRVKGGGQYGVHTTYLAMGAPCDNCCQGKPLGVNTPIIRHLYGYTSLAGCRALECVGQVSQKTHLMELEATQRFQAATQVYQHRQDATRVVEQGQRSL